MSEVTRLGFQGRGGFNSAVSCGKAPRRRSDALNPARRPRQTAADTQPQPRITQTVLSPTMKTDRLSVCLSVSALIFLIQAVLTEPRLSGV